MTHCSSKYKIPCYTSFYRNAHCLLQKIKTGTERHAATPKSNFDTPAGPLCITKSRNNDLEPLTALLKTALLKTETKNQWPDRGASREHWISTLEAKANFLDRSHADNCHSSRPGIPKGVGGRPDFWPLRYGGSAHCGCILMHERIPNLFQPTPPVLVPCKKRLPETPSRRSFRTRWATHHRTSRAPLWREHASQYPRFRSRIALAISDLPKPLINQ